MLTAALVLAACGGGDTDPGDAPRSATDDSGDDGSEDLVAAAQAEGELTLYHGSPEEETREWVQGFVEEYGIEVRQYRATTNPLWERWLQETQSGQHLADLVVLSDAGVFEEADELGMVAEYLPEEDEHFPDDLKEAGKWYPIYVFAQAIAYNLDVVGEDGDDLIRTEGLDALRDDRWQGQVGIQAAVAARQAQAVYYLLGDGELGEAYGWDFIEAIAAQSPTIYDSGVPLLERIVAGEHAVTLAVPDTSAQVAALEGAPVRWVYSEPTVAAPFVMTISENAPSPNAARLFQEWALRPESLQRLQELTHGEIVHDQVEDDRPINELDWFEPPASLYTDWQTDEAFAAAQSEIAERWADLFGFDG